LGRVELINQTLSQYTDFYDAVVQYEMLFEGNVAFGASYRKRIAANAEDIYNQFLKSTAVQLLDDVYDRTNHSIILFVGCRKPHFVLRPSSYLWSSDAMKAS
jgi:hypothetical protein